MSNLSSEGDETIPGLKARGQVSVISITRVVLICLVMYASFIHNENETCSAIGPASHVQLTLRLYTFESDARTFFL